MAYPAAMDTHPTFPSDLWAQTPPEVRAYIGTLEARVVALEAMVQALQEQLKKDSVLCQGWRILGCTTGRGVPIGDTT